MNILAVETSTLTGSVALLRDEEVAGEITLSVSVQHSERLMPAIDQLLRNAGVDPSSIDLFAVSRGPGSFTGLRIGIAAAQGFSLAHGKPMMGISTLEALAMNGVFFPGLIVPMIDAFRGEIYRGLYSFEKSGLRALAEDKVTGIQALIKEIGGREALFLGNGLRVCPEEMIRALKVRVVPSPFNQPRASNVAWLALQKWYQGLRKSPVLPNYLRRPG